MSDNNALGLEESQRYDRQIRIWGAEAQHRIQRAKVLVCGLRGLAVELVKNIVLAGVNVTVQDHREVTFQDLSHNFFLSHEDLGSKIVEGSLGRIQSLNNYAKIETVSEEVSKLPDEFFSGFDLILYNYFSKDEFLRLSEIGRKKSPQIVLFWSQTFLEEGIFYSDFGDCFEYKQDPSNNNNNNNNSTNTNSQLTIKTARFPPVSEVLSRPWSSITSRFHPLSTTYIKSRVLSAFLEQTGRLPEPSDLQLLVQVYEQLLTLNGVSSKPLQEQDLQDLINGYEYTTVLVCSVLGGILSQEFIKAITRTGVPAFNVTVYSADTYVAKSFPVKVRENDGV